MIEQRFADRTKRETDVLKRGTEEIHDEGRANSGETDAEISGKFVGDFHFAALSVQFVGLCGVGEVAHEDEGQLLGNGPDQA